MALYSIQNARPVGKGHHSPGGSVTDPELAGMVSRYKRTVAGRYSALTPDEVETRLLPGPYKVSPKVDGEQWCMVFSDGDVFLANPSGRVLSGDIPVLNEARTIATRTRGVTVVAGELFATRKQGRTRHSDLAAALGDEERAEVARIGFMAFDLVAGGDADAVMPIGAYEGRLEVLRRVMKDGKRVQAIKTETVDSKERVAELFTEWAADGKAEGIVVRTSQEVTFKVKPSVTIDAVVVGYTQRSEDPTQTSSLLIAVMRNDGMFQIIGHCGNLGSDDDRRALQRRLADLTCASNYSEANSRGAIFQAVRPELVVEVRVSDVQAQLTSGDPVPRMSLEFVEGRWKAVRKMAGVSILHPVLVRVRDDKQVRVEDVSIRQLLERVLVPELDAKASRAGLPASELLRREVYSKDAKTGMSIRKLVMWKTNKETVDPAYPSFVVQFTDYSAGRKEPLKRTVRLAATLASATCIADDIIAEEIKRGWNKLV